MGLLENLRSRRSFSSGASNLALSLQIVIVSILLKNSEDYRRFTSWRSTALLEVL
jgi:hypothetical protein